MIERNNEIGSQGRDVNIPHTRQQQDPGLRGTPLTDRATCDGKDVAGEVSANLAGRVEAAASPAGSGQAGTGGRQGTSPSYFLFATGAWWRLPSPSTGARRSPWRSIWRAFRPLAFACNAAETPTSSTFQGIATPERQVIFAINDLDETLPAPWEWDLKRLTTSFVIACRDNGLSESDAKDAVLSCVRSYREHMAEFAEMKVLELWYFAVAAEMLIAGVKDHGIRHGAIKNLAKARESSSSEGLFPKLAGDSGGSPVIKDQLPAIYHWKGHTAGEIHPDVRDAFVSTPKASAPNYRMLLDRYELKDAAVKVVGVGSVGTACWMMLFVASEEDPLILQVKEARASVLEAYAGKSVYPNHGQRVVNGHRLMQPASDIFLGWTEGKPGGT